MAGQTVPDSVALGALGAMVSVATFASGFFSVRLHNAHREALSLHRGLVSKLRFEWKQPEQVNRADLETHYRTVHEAIGDAFSWLVLSFQAIVLVAGSATWIAAAQEVDWLADTSWSQRLAMSALGVALVAVTLLTLLDFWFLRRSLRRAALESVVGTLLAAESLANQCARPKRHQRQLRKHRSDLMYMKARLELNLADLDEQILASKAQRRNRLSGFGKAARKVRKSRRWFKRKIRKLERTISKVEARGRDLERGARRATPCEDADDLLQALTSRYPVLKSWGRLAGLRAMLVLAEQLDVLFEWAGLGDDTKRQLEDDLALACADEPDQARWWSARSRVAELRDLPGDAVDHHVQALAHFVRDVTHDDDTPLQRRLSSRAAQDTYYVLPGNWQTYLGAVRHFKADGDAISAAFEIDVLIGHLGASLSSWTTDRPDWPPIKDEIVDLMTWAIGELVGEHGVGYQNLAAPRAAEWRVKVKDSFLSAGREDLLEAISRFESELIPAGQARFDEWLASLRTNSTASSGA